MNLMDIFKRQEKERDLPLELRKAEARKAIMNLLSEASHIDGVLLIYSADDTINTAQGGINDVFEAGVYLNRAQYLINRDGLPIP